MIYFQPHRAEHHGLGSEEDFYDLISDIDPSSNKFGLTVKARNVVEVQILNHLHRINFPATAGGV